MERKRERSKKKRKKSTKRGNSGGSKKLIGYAIFDSEPREGERSALLTRVVNGVASACVTIGN